MTTDVETNGWLYYIRLLHNPGDLILSTKYYWRGERSRLAWGKSVGEENILDELRTLRRTVGKEAYCFRKEFTYWIRHLEEGGRWLCQPREDGTWCPICRKEQENTVSK